MLKTIHGHEMSESIPVIMTPEEVLNASNTGVFYTFAEPAYRDLSGPIFTEAQTTEADYYVHVAVVPAGLGENTQVKFATSFKGLSLLPYHLRVAIESGVCFDKISRVKDEYGNDIFTFYQEGYKGGVSKPTIELYYREANYN